LLTVSVAAHVSVWGLRFKAFQAGYYGPVEQRTGEAKPSVVVEVRLLPEVGIRKGQPQSLESEKPHPVGVT